MVKDFRFDVAVIGGTPAGIAAALAAAREGASVLLVERTLHLGGLMASGLGATDISVPETVGGLFRRFVQRVRRHYETTYGAESEQVVLCRDGYHFEPSVAERVLEEMVAEAPSLTIWRGMHVAWEGGATLHDGGRWLVETVPGAGPGDVDGTPERRVTAVTLEALDAKGVGTGRFQQVEAGVFIDATYEGDVALGAGASYRIGRESREQFGESHAGTIYQDFITRICHPSAASRSGAADRRIQAYNYRLCLTRDPQLRRPPQPPPDYDRCHYESLVEEVRSGRTPVFMAPRDTWGLLDVIDLPNGKTDCNNSPFSLCSTDWPEENVAYPEAGPALRREIERRYREYVEGLLWFAQHDPALPARFRAEASEWGFAADEFTDNNNFPRQVYVRGAARIAGEYVFTMHDALPGPDGKRAPVHWDSVACGAFQIDSHATRKREDEALLDETHENDGRRVALEGLFVVPSVPYGVPFRTMLPLGLDGLLVPVALSASHAGFGTLRMEPTWMALGEAAGTAAALAVQHGARVRDVSRALLQRRLLEHGQVIALVADVPPPGFSGCEQHPAGLSQALQFWSTRGFFPSYAAWPERTLTAGEAVRWAWLFGWTVDPWRPVPVDAARFEAAEPVCAGGFFEVLSAALANPSPLRRSLGIPDLCAVMDGSCGTSDLGADQNAGQRTDRSVDQRLDHAHHDGSHPISRGDACRLLYRLHGAYVSCAG